MIVYTQVRISTKLEIKGDADVADTSTNGTGGTSTTQQRAHTAYIGNQKKHERPIMRIIKGDLDWSPTHPWDAPPDGLFDESDTGSFENCTGSFTPVNPRINSLSGQPTAISDIRTITVSCHELGYRAPLNSILHSGKVLIGVLSAASGSGPRRRNYIRSTWGSKFPGLFFLVAGPWEDVKDEFTFYQDMIWIDEEEIYKGEDSVLTYKTMSYFAIVHKLAKKVEEGGFEYAIKTDDDSYVNIERIYDMLFHGADIKKSDPSLDFFGQCPQFQVMPSRDPSNKWSVSYAVYPEPKFPLYCQGAGFGLSRSLLSCAEHVIPKIRYQPFEDASIGLLAERCGYAPTMVAGVRVFRADTPKERACVNAATPMSECYKDDPQGWPPKPPNMSNILVQHRVETKEDMVNIHKSMDLKPEWVDLVITEGLNADSRIQAKINDGVEWTKKHDWAQV
mmetsp:Transcript_8332/g.10966  ORF Transcript_8332/g.10966 Transcript_8332/m.10966 type:complete len:449 (-) Transcript_8332:189-1535(-)